MPIYRYQALSRRGKEEKGILEAANPQAARKVLRLKGLYVKKLDEDREKKERELFPFLSKLLYRVPRRDVGLFARQLGTLLKAGLPLDRSLNNIIDQTENEYLKKALFEVRASVVEGEKLSDALKKHPAIFPPMYNNLISVGEATGAYEQSLIRLADLEAANEALRGKITTALFYPVIMLSLLGAIIVFLLAVVFPQIKDLFVKMNADLPLITRLVLGASEILTTKKILIPITLIGGGTAYLMRWKQTPEGRVKFEKFLFNLPLFGTLIRKAILARFARNMSVMLENGVPLISALQVVAKVVENKIFEADIQMAIAKIREGKKLTDGFQDSLVVNQMILGMLRAGEASDTIPEMVHRIADVMDDDVNSYVQKLSALLEPAMMVLMGGTIVIIMASIMMPMYDLTNQLQL